MNSRRKIFFISFIKYSFSLVIAIALFWYVYRDLDFNELFLRFKEVNLVYIYISLFLGLISYWLRAYRWSLLFEPVGFQIGSFRSFISLMVGYFANLLVPRMGEVTRCIILKKTDKVDLPVSIGTVVAERVIDMICLLIIIFFGFAIEFDKLKATLFPQVFEKVKVFQHYYLILTVGIVLAIFLLFLFIYLFKKYYYKIHRYSLYIKFRAVVREILDGFLAVRRLKRPYLFWFSTVGIWILYFYMSYVVFFSFEPTADLSIYAGILVLIMGGLGMATPVQAGVGAFHLFVSSVLFLYGVSEDDGKFFAFVLHTSQFLFVVVVGGISFIISLSLSKNEKDNAIER